MSDAGRNDLIIVGAGALGSEYMWAAEEMNAEAARLDRPTLPWVLVGFVDDERRTAALGKYVVLGNIEETSRKRQGIETWFAVALGDNHRRAELAIRAEEAGWRPATLIHPSVIIAPGAQIGAGSYIGAGSIICPRATVDRHVVINVHVTVGHDSVLRDFSQACPGARINGNCGLGVYSFLGSNATLGPGVLIGDDSVVGANSHAVRNVQSGITVIGCPARRIVGLRPPAAVST